MLKIIRDDIRCLLFIPLSLFTLYISIFPSFGRCFEFVCTQAGLFVFYSYPVVNSVLRVRKPQTKWVKMDDLILFCSQVSFSSLTPTCCTSSSSPYSLSWCKTIFWGACCLLEYRRGQILYFLSRWKQSGFILPDPIKFLNIGAIILHRWRKQNKHEANRKDSNWSIQNQKLVPNIEAASITRLFCVFSLEIQLKKAQLYL